MYNEPRIGRYKAMKQLRDAIEDVKVSDQRLWFSTCNLSYVSLVELDTTARILVGFIVRFFRSLLQRTYTIEDVCENPRSAQYEDAAPNSQAAAALANKPRTEQSQMQKLLGCITASVCNPCRGGVK